MLVQMLEIVATVAKRIRCPKGPSYVLVQGKCCESMRVKKLKNRYLIVEIYGCMYCSWNKSYVLLVLKSPHWSEIKSEEDMTVAKSFCWYRMICRSFYCVIKFINLQFLNDFVQGIVLMWIKDCLYRGPNFMLLFVFLHEFWTLVWILIENGVWIF